MQLNFKIKIGTNGLLTDISEPFGLDYVGFVTEQQEDYYGKTSNFIGNDRDLEFNSSSHKNIFRELIEEYRKGLNAYIEIFFYFNNELIAKGTADIQGVETDEYKYFRCQFINKNKLYVLNKNKSIKTDVSTLPSYRYMLKSTKIVKKSLFTAINNTTDRYAGTFNIIKRIKESEIKDTIINGARYVDNNTTWGRYLHRIIDCKENLSSIKVELNFNNLKIRPIEQYGQNTTIECWLMWGDDVNGDQYDDWFYNIVNKRQIFRTTFSFNNPLNMTRYSTTVDLSDLTVGKGIWFCFQIIDSGHEVTQTEASDAFIKITANSLYYDTLTYSKKVTDVFSKVVKDIAGIENVNFNNIDYFNENAFFNGDLIRRITNKKLTISWDDVATMLQEVNLGYWYDEDTDTLHIDRYENFFKNTMSVKLTNISNNKYKKSFNQDFVTNEFSYKFKSFQSQKENEIEGNANSVHGEVQCSIKNNTVEGIFAIDLKHIRCSFLIEEQRRKGLKYEENTSTQEDSNLFLIHSELSSGQYVINNNFLLVTQTDAQGVTTMANDGSWSFINIGFPEEPQFGQTMYIDGSEYFLLSVSNTVITVSRFASSPIIPGNNKFKAYNVVIGVNIDYISIMDDNGLLNSKYSVRQNIENGYKKILSTHNYNNNKTIDITEYKDNYNAVINGLKEDTPIVANEPILSPYFAELEILSTINIYTQIKNSMTDYITVLDHGKKEVNLYVQKLEMTLIGRCGECKINIKGFIKA